MPISGEDSDPITVVNNVKRVQMWKGMTDAGEHVLFPAITVVSENTLITIMQNIADDLHTGQTRHIQIPTAIYL